MIQRDGAIKNSLYTHQRISRARRRTECWRPAEAEEWRGRYEAEIARLDATGPRAPDGERADYINYLTREFAPHWVRRPPGR